jgi:hypothetical protein
MFLGAYHFDGDPAALRPAYDALMSGFPEGSLDLHVCVVRDGGLTVFDACPSREDFEAFSGGADFAAALAAVGLPTPRIELLGDVHAARLRSGVSAS